MARTLTGPGLGRALAGGWGLFWNDLLAGAAPGTPRVLAAAAQRGFGAVTGRDGGAPLVPDDVSRRPVAAGQFRPASRGKSAKRRALPGWRRSTARHSASGVAVHGSVGSARTTNQPFASSSDSSWPGPQPA